MVGINKSTSPLYCSMQCSVLDASSDLFSPVRAEKDDPEQGLFVQAPVNLISDFSPLEHFVTVVQFSC